MFVKPVGQGITLVVIYSILQPLATIAICLRIYARYLIKGIGIDDYLMVVGFVSYPLLMYMQ